MKNKKCNNIIEIKWDAPIFSEMYSWGIQQTWNKKNIFSF